MFYYKYTYELLNISRYLLDNIFLLAIFWDFNNKYPWLVKLLNIFNIIIKKKNTLS